MAIHLMTEALKINLIILLTIFFASSVPLYNIFFTDKNDMIVPIILPFFDPDSQSGIYMNLVNQLVFCAYGAIIIPGTELVTCVLKNAVSVTAHVIENALIEFDDSLQQSTEHSSEQLLKFRNIILRILDYDKFVTVSFSVEVHKFDNFIQFSGSLLM